MSKFKLPWRVLSEQFPEPDWLCLIYAPEDLESMFLGTLVELNGLRSIWRVHGAHLHSTERQGVCLVNL